MKILIIIIIILGILFLLLCLGIVHYSRDYIDELNPENNDEIYEDKDKHKENDTE